MKQKEFNNRSNKIEIDYKMILINGFKLWLNKEILMILKKQIYLEN